MVSKLLNVVSTFGYCKLLFKLQYSEKTILMELFALARVEQYFFTTERLKNN